MTEPLLRLQVPNRPWCQASARLALTWKPLSRGTALKAACHVYRCSLLEHWTHLPACSLFPLAPPLSRVPSPHPLAMLSPPSQVCLARTTFKRHWLPTAATLALRESSVKLSLRRVATRAPPVGTARLPARRAFGRRLSAALPALTTRTWVRPAVLRACLAAEAPPTQSPAAATPACASAACQAHSLRTRERACVSNARLARIRTPVARQRARHAQLAIFARKAHLLNCRV